MTNRLSRVAIAALLSAAACGSDTKPAGPPATIQKVTSPSASSTVGTPVGAFAVQVADASGTPVAGAPITFSVTGGGFAAPAAISTDASGQAQTIVNAGGVAGPQTVTAIVTGTQISTTATFTSVPGPLAQLQLSPDAVRLTAVGDTARLTVAGLDSYGNTVTAGAVTFTSLDPTSVSVSPAGTVTALKVGVSVGVVASSGGRADTTTVSVIAPGSSPCIGLASQTAMTVGQISTVQNTANLCLTGTATGAEFTLIAFNSDPAASHSTTITATGTGTAPSTTRLAPLGTLASRGTDLLTASGLHPDLAFHARLRAQATKLAPLVPAARQWQASRRAARSATGGLAPSGASRSAIPSNPKVGDLVQLNMDGQGDCTTIQLKTAMVVAVGTKSVVLADTTNPANGFTATDYQNFAAKFDTLIYNLDVTNFGAPSDIDNNGRVGILFTRAVNELTSANSSSYVGGFFADRDLFPKTGTTHLQGCGGSNEGEMFYMLAPDPTGVVNGNKRSVALIQGLTAGTIAHEFQHLINASRRLFVNNADQYPEVTWMNEGLSHVAEELLYYREAGRQPRTDLTDANIRQESSTNYNIWKADQSQNFLRFQEYLLDPASSGVQGTDDYTDDELSTRGATWSFLRYAADRFYSSDADVWFKLVNSTTTGLNTLRLAFGNDPVSVIRDYTVANYVDDASFATDPIYQHKSWNYHDIFTKTFQLSGGGAAPYPLKVTGLPSGASVPVSVVRTSAGYFRLSVPANADALIGLSGNGSAPNASFQFIVVRTR